MTQHRFRLILLSQFLIIVLIASVIVAPQSASAATPTASQWDAGFIISDEQFYDYNSMNEAQIQAFLEARVPVCETWRSTGPGDPIVCIKDYQMSTVSMAADAYCTSPYQAGTDERASTIIYKVAQACKINPKVILTTLEKEQSLVTHTWPSAFRYTKAMGYGCSDTAPCIETYGGLQKQIYLAAKQFQRYRVNPGGYNHRAGQNNNILYYPANTRPECGYSTVYIENVATASLYNYTPYQPDGNALANPTGLGGWCSSYGNRNFWVLWWKWFGNPQTGAPAGVTASRIGGPDRFAVGVGISQQYFPAGASTVYVADGANFPDALSAAPAAAHAGGPLLLVSTEGIPASVDAELRRLAPKKIIVAGGPASVTDAVFSQLGGYGATVTRQAGKDRYEVSRNVTRTEFGASGSTIAYLATGETFPDALSASAAAGFVHAPVVLVAGLSDSLDADTAALLTQLGVTDVRIAGGPASVSPGIEAGVGTLPGVKTVTRLGGADRFEVSSATNRAVFSSASTVFVASGYNFPDALSGAAVAGAAGIPLYVIPTDCIPNYVLDDFVTYGVNDMKILGGPATVAPSVESFARCN